MTGPLSFCVSMLMLLNWHFTTRLNVITVCPNPSRCKPDCVHEMKQRRPREMRKIRQFVCGFCYWIPEGRTLFLPNLLKRTTHSKIVYLIAIPSTFASLNYLQVFSCSVLTLLVRWREWRKSHISFGVSEQEHVVLRFEYLSWLGIWWVLKLCCVKG